MREIITLQFGADANFVGSHFWNVQESYFSNYSNDLSEAAPGGGLGSKGEQTDEAPGLNLVEHDIHFRTGIGADGSDTYLPRTLIYDAKYQFGALRKENALYALMEEDSRGGAGGDLWQGQTIEQAQRKILPSEYTSALDSAEQIDEPTLTKARKDAVNDRTVRFWSDYLHVYYHPRSLFPLTLDRGATSLGPSFWTANSARDTRTSTTATGPVASATGLADATSQKGPDLDYSDGDDLWEHMNADVDGGNGWESEDFRRFLEECDSPQGVQVMTNVTGPWGNVAGQAVERIRDELNKTDIWVWGIEGPGGSSRTKRTKTAVNLALSLQAIVPFATTYVPIRSNSPPNWARLTNSSGDYTSWRMSALQALAIESMLLPTRLYPSAASSSMQEMSMTLNLTGHRKIAKLETEVLVPRDEGRSGDDRGEVEKYSFLDEDGLRPFGGRAKRKREHVFATAKVERGEVWKTDQFQKLSLNDDDDEDASFPRDTRSFSTPLLFPIVETYPDILAPASSRAGVSIRAGLSVSTAVSQRLDTLSSFVRRAAGGAIGVGERETLANELDEWRDEYKEGWESESDDDD